MDYKSAGVDVEKGDELVDWIKGTQKAPGPYQDKMVSGVGGFASIMEFDFPQYKKPCLVSATDGVGTKLKLAVLLESYGTIGQDLVAMCVNDLACTGADPLFFLDYYATGHLDFKQAKPFIEGVQKACNHVGAQLVGGETAEMPGVYQGRDFDCAGFAVGVVDRDEILGPHRVQAGDVAVAIKSSGFHSNGYSLLRKLFEKDLETRAEELLTPTALYVDVIKSIPREQLRAAAHITGGGIDNISRVLPKGLGLKAKLWEIPALYLEAQKRGELSTSELLKTFNCGVGFVIMVAKDSLDSVLESLKSTNHESFVLGEICKQETPLIIEGMNSL